MRRNFFTRSINCTKKRKPGNSSFFRNLFIFSFFIFVLVLSGLDGLDADYNPALSKTPGLPFYLGKSIYHSNENSPNQLYIIGMAHRDTFTEANNDHSVTSQIEVYRIAEWLINNEGVELLLPEGYFMNSEAIHSSEKRDTTTGERSSHNAAALRERLQNDNVYTNAEMLLMENWGIQSRQVEDEDMYNAVKTGTLLLADKSIDEYEALYVMSSITYLQARRTAVMLQNIPDVINDEFSGRRITSKKAIFTVGLSHVFDIITYLENGQITINSPAFHASYNDYFSELKLLQDNYGVTVIIPKTLAENRDVARLAKLDQAM